MGAVEGAIIGWNTQGTAALIPRRDIPYGDIGDRLLRYTIADAYLHNTIYDALNLNSTWIKQEERLYKFIRGISNPVKQENDLIVSYTYKGTIDTQNLKGGSMPLVYENDALEDPLKQLIKWSNLDTQLGQYVRDAALYGDAAWWICDDPVKERVRMELLDPARIKYVERDQVGNVTSAVLEYWCDEQPDVERYQPGRFGMQLLETKRFIKTIKITKEAFYTYKDGKPFAFYADSSSGKLVPEWPNVYGFVPIKLAMFQAGKDGWGQNSFFGTVRRQIDELNDQASIINDSIRNVVVPLLQALNIRNSGEISITREDRDSMAIVYINKDNAKLEPITVPLDITAAAANREQLYAELKKSMPILALQDIRDIGGNLSGVAIQNMFGDAVSSIENVRKNLNPPLAAALQMALTIGGIRGYEGFKGINASTYDTGDMELSIKEYPVIDDKLTKSEKVDKLISIAPLPVGTKRFALMEIGYLEKDIETIVSEDEAQKQEQMAQVQANAQQLGQGANGKTPPLPPGQKPGQNGANPQAFGDMMGTWKKLGISAAMGAG